MMIPFMSTVTLNGSQIQSLFKLSTQYIPTIFIRKPLRQSTSCFYTNKKTGMYRLYNKIVHFELITNPNGTVLVPVHAERACTVSAHSENP